MKRTLIIATLAAAVAGPVAADTAAAIQHFNMDVDRVTELRAVPSGDTSVTVSARNGSALDQALAIFNGSEESLGEIRGQNGATVYASATNPIFDAIRAESLENE